jgi:hypothetical protein
MLMIPGFRIISSLAESITASQSAPGATPSLRILAASAEAASGLAWRIVRSNDLVAPGSSRPTCQSSGTFRAFSRLVS